MPAVISEHVSGHPWRRAVNGFDGTEVEGDDIPAWVVECVLQSRLPAQRDMKCAFVLQPAEGSPLPGMVQTRLNAPRILRIGKVASYTVSKLSEQGHNMMVLPPGLSPAAEEAERVRCSRRPDWHISLSTAAPKALLDLLAQWSGLTLPVCMPLCFANRRRRAGCRCWRSPAISWRSRST